MKNLSYFAASAIFALIFATGCASTDAPLPPSQVNYTANSKYTYAQNPIDTTTGQITGSADIITSTVMQTGFAYQGKTNVTSIENVHSIGTKDTTYIAQD